MFDKQAWVIYSGESFVTSNKGLRKKVMEIMAKNEKYFYLIALVLGCYDIESNNLDLIKIILVYIFIVFFLFRINYKIKFKFF